MDLASLPADVLNEVFGLLQNHQSTKVYMCNKWLQGEMIKMASMKLSYLIAFFAHISSSLVPPPQSDIQSTQDRILPIIQEYFANLRPSLLQIAKLVGSLGQPLSSTPYAAYFRSHITPSILKWAIEWHNITLDAQALSGKCFKPLC